MDITKTISLNNAKLVIQDVLHVYLIATVRNV